MPQDLLEFLGNTEDGVFVVDNEQRIVLWNKAAQKILGFKADEVLGKHCHQVIGSDVGGKGHQCMQDCNVVLVSRRGAVPPSVTCATATKDGKGKWLHITHIAVPLGPTPQQIALVHVFRDVTHDIEARGLIDGLARFVQEGAEARPLAAGALAPAASADQALTQREVQVLRLMAEGCGTSAIADNLVISVSTARNHIQNILEKLGVHSRMEAVMHGIRHGLIAAPATPAS